MANFHPTKRSEKGEFSNKNIGERLTTTARGAQEIENKRIAEMKYNSF